MIRTALAFIRRDFLLAVSYKASFAAQVVAILAKVTIFYFLGGVLQNAGSPKLQEYGGNYFAFLLIGVAFWDYLAASLTAFNTTMRESQMMGTLEMTLLAPIPTWSMLIYSSLWSYLFASFRVLLFLLFGVLLFGLDVGNANVGAGLLILLMSILSCAAIGIGLACLIIVFKQGDAKRFVTLTSVILGGTFFPVDLLPGSIQNLSALVPMTHSLNGMRKALLQNHSVAQLSAEIAALATFSIVLLPLGLVAFSYAVQQAKRSGTLAHY